MASGVDNGPVPQVRQQLGSEDDGEPEAVLFEDGDECVQCGSDFAESLHWRGGFCEFLLFRRLRLGM